MTQLVIDKVFLNFKVHTFLNLIQNTSFFIGFTFLKIALHYVN